MCKFLFSIAAFLSIKATAQTLFTYGKDSVSVKEFLQAYHKNNSGNKSSKAVQEYLDLYIASRLKIREAKEKGYDTLPQLVSDLANLRSQIAPSYQKDAETLNKLVDEAFVRSQKDIHLAHIFIGFITGATGNIDTVAAQQKAKEAYGKLQRNTPFAEVARKYSDDTSARENGGDIGFITVFTLPYELESLAYNTPAGKISAVYRSKAGYHIFKNLEERKAAGRVRAAQILLAFPPDASAVQKQQVKKQADSLYIVLQKGGDIGKLASKFSVDRISSAANGMMPEFGVGQYDAEFEKVVYGLKNGELSKPFMTEHGYHIVKSMGIVPVNADKNDEAAMKSLKEKVEQSDRANITKEVLVRKVMKQENFQMQPFQTTQLWAYSDSMFNAIQPQAPLSLNSSTRLFTIGNKTVTVANWITYGQNNRYKADGSGLKSYNRLWDEFVQASILDYYNSNLEKFNDEFRSQMNEFKEGNLFFEIMQRQVWNPAQSDTSALKSYYKKHQSEYVWDKSAEAVIFYAGDATTAQNLAARVKKTPRNWRKLVAEMQDKVTADSGRFELKQIPGGANTVIKDGIVTDPVVNKDDNTASFASVIRVYMQPAQRSFEEARGMVVNSYQAELEKQWIASLKTKYPVTINQKALEMVMKDL